MCQTEKDSNLRYLKVRTEREFEGKSVEVGVVIDVEAVQALQAAHLCGPIRGQYSRCGPIRDQYYLATSSPCSALSASEVSLALWVGVASMSVSAIWYSVWSTYF